MGFKWILKWNAQQNKLKCRSWNQVRKSKSAVEYWSAKRDVQIIKESMEFVKCWTCFNFKNLKWFIKWNRDWTIWGANEKK